MGVLQRSHNDTSGCTDVLHESAQKNGRKLVDYMEAGSAFTTTLTDCAVEAMLEYTCIDSVFSTTCPVFSFQIYSITACLEAADFG